MSSAHWSLLTVPFISTEGRADAHAATSSPSGPPPAMTRFSPGSPDFLR